MTRAPHRPGPVRTLLLAGLTVILAAGFAALGLWQVERRAWKIDLIDRIEIRITAEPVAPPAPAEWPDVTRDNAEYLRVEMEGRFHEGEALVQAVTEAGSGYWVIAPFAAGEGATILVNRGFIPSDERQAARPVPEGPQRVVGLLRLSEPDGGFLRANDPIAGRWYSRDVQAIAADMGVDRVAPFFVDAEAGANGGGPPLGGLTVVAFRNSHLVYALTWFALSAMCGGASFMVLCAGFGAGRRRGRPA